MAKFSVYLNRRVFVMKRIAAPEVYPFLQIRVKSMLVLYCVRLVLVGAYYPDLLKTVLGYFKVFLLMLKIVKTRQPVLWKVFKVNVLLLFIILFIDFL